MTAMGRRRADGGTKKKAKAPRAVLCVVEDVVQPEGVHVKGGHDMEASQNIVVEVNALGRD